jgi:hypothetical protein
VAAAGASRILAIAKVAKGLGGGVRLIDAMSATVLGAAMADADSAVATGPVYVQVVLVVGGL